MFNVTISSGMTSSSFDVDIINNTIQDGNKMFFITIRLISTCLPTSMKYNTSNVTIIDDEGAYGTVLAIPSTHTLFLP